VPTNTAIFSTSNTGTLTFEQNSFTSINAIQFNAGAPAYTFNIGAARLNIYGAGIVNNSLGTPTFSSVLGGIWFYNSSTAGNSNFINSGVVTNSAITTGPSLLFLNNSSAGSATITNQLGEAIQFYDTSTAGTATIQNSFGATIFINGSKAGAATITNTGGSFVVNGNTVSAEGYTLFVNSASAENAKITNNAGGVAEFQNSSSAGNAVIINNSGGVIFFLDTSTGGNARIINNSGGAFDISALSSSGTGVGSIEGGGHFYLGSKNLTTGSNNLNTEVSGIISGGTTVTGVFPAIGGSLTKIGTGALTLSGANTYTGGTTLSAGTLIIGNDSALGSGMLSMAAGTTLSFLNTGNFTVANPITISGDPNFAPPSGTTQTLSGVIANGISPGTLNVNGAGTLVLSGANSYSGGTAISSGTLQVTNNNSVGTGPVTLDGGTFQSGGAGLSFNNAFAINISGGTIDTQANTLTLSGVIADGNGPGALTKIGSGTLILAGVDTYSGPTNINGGILQVDGAITSSSNVTVNAGGTLTGIGNVDSGIIINSGGTLAPGDRSSPTGTMIIGSISRSLVAPPTSLL